MMTCWKLLPEAAFALHSQLLIHYLVHGCLLRCLLLHSQTACFCASNGIPALSS
jgi:hypothetical protein